MQKETAKIMGVSQSQISRIERQALDTLRKWLYNKGEAP